MAATRTPVQGLARFALFAPIVAIGLNVVSAGAVKDSNPGRLVIGVVSGLMVLAGMVAGVVALVAISKHGRRGVLWPAIGGLTLSSLVVSFLLVGLVMARQGRMPTLDDLPLRKQMAGSWLCDKGDFAMRIYIESDDTFHFVMSGNRVADFSGKWAVQRRVLHLNVETIAAGNANELRGKTIRWGIQTLDATRLVLDAKDGQDRYVRQ